VFADGNPDASVMIIGEAPDEHEDASGVPFVGKAGELLDSLIIEAGADPTDVHITNLVMCRPPDDRDPSNPEIKACRPRLMEQIRIVDPDLIIASGRLASKALTGQKNLAITKNRGEIFDCSLKGEMVEYKIPVMATIHPVALLRNPDKSKGGILRNTIEDFTSAFAVARKAKRLWGEDYGR
jgi:uracil-DNA glycosylase family 4